MGRKWELENPEKYRECHRKWRLKNPDKLLEYNRRYREKNKEKLAQYSIDYNKKYPERIKAKNKTMIEIRAGRLERPEYCERCNRKVRTHAHHKDYNNVHDIEWLCSSCHGKEHSDIEY